jgi:uncharacterized SAM-binding protein YcdF (DUF218 family)
MIQMDIMKIIKSIIFLVGLLTFIWFLLPFVTHGIMNIGNVTGLVISSGIMVYAWQMTRINCWLGEVWNKIIGKVVLSIIGLCIVIVIGLVIVITSCMITANTNKAKENSTVIVLGCKVNGESASLTLVERLEAAYAYLIENPNSICILSGGKGTDEDISEAECMYRYLTDKGISQERLYKEEKSTSTRENLSFSKEIMDRYQLNQKVAIVTNEFHEYRAGKVAQSLGLEYSAVAARTAWWLFSTYYVRELYGILYEWVY